MRRRDVIGLVIAAGVMATAGSVLAQGATSFTARLDWVPISGAERNDVGGGGSATATLSRSRLSITGSFEGLPAAATRASLHQGVATGARGPAIAELEITKSAKGTLSGEVAPHKVRDFAQAIERVPGGSTRGMPATITPEIRVPTHGHALYVFTLPDD